MRGVNIRATAVQVCHREASFHLQTYNNDKKMNNHVTSNVQQQKSDPVALLSTRVEENNAGDDEPDAGNLHERHRLCDGTGGVGGVFSAFVLENT